ncbi:hypothetical protein NMY22_g2820 [Coprinellus aureogranulatus]|nr:hypothetical protein NMY22_g2820 [Coprinellus aureogranulatus]
MSGLPEVEGLKRQVTRLAEDLEDLKQDKRSFRRYNDHLMKDLDDARNQLENERSLQSKIATDSENLVAKNEEDERTPNVGLIRELSQSLENLEGDLLLQDNRDELRSLRNDLDQARQDIGLLEKKIEEGTLKGVTHSTEIAELRLKVERLEAVRNINAEGLRSTGNPFQLGTVGGLGETREAFSTADAQMAEALAAHARVGDTVIEWTKHLLATGSAHPELSQERFDADRKQARNMFSEAMEKKAEGLRALERQLERIIPGITASRPVATAA